MNAPKNKKSMPSMSSQNKVRQNLVKQVFELVIPFGKFRLLTVFALVVLQGILQVVGVTSIFPFLALAADPERIYNSQYGRWFLSFLPEMENSQLLLVAGLFSISMMFLANFVCVVGEYVRNKYAHDYGHWLRIQLLNRMLDQPYSYFMQNNSSVLFKKVYTDVMGYINFVLLPLLEVIAKIFTCLLLVFTLLFIHLKIALLAAAGLTGFYLIIYLALRKRRQAISDEYKSAWRDSAQYLNQLFGGIKPVKVHEVEESFVHRFAEPSRTLAKNGAWVPIYSNVPRHIIEPVAFGGMIAIVVFLNARGRDMATVLPNMGVMALAGYKLMPSLQLIYGQLTKIAASRHNLEEVYDEYDSSKRLSVTKRSAKSQAPVSWEHTLGLSDVTFRYPDSNAPVFQDLNLTIEKNSSVAFVGKTGSGKSTIIDLIMGLHQPESGHLVVDGQKIERDQLGAFRAAIGYVPQEVFLIDDTVAANIALGIEKGKVDEDLLHESANAAQILDFVSNKLPNGFETIVGERGVRLSGGQRQRIGLARALYRNPSILVFDEATSALDNETESELMNSIESLGSEKTIILVAHRLTTTQNCDRIYRLEYGQLVEVEYSCLS